MISAIAAQQHLKAPFCPCRALFAEKTAAAVAYERSLTGQQGSSAAPAPIEDVFDTAFTIGKS